MATTPSTSAGGSGAVTLRKIAPMIKATARIGKMAMNKWFSKSRSGTAALRLPLMARIRPGSTLLLTVVETTCAKGGRGTTRSSADMGGARCGFHLASNTT